MGDRLNWPSGNDSDAWAVRRSDFFDRLQKMDEVDRARTYGSRELYDRLRQAVQPNSEKPPDRMVQ